MTIRPAVNTDLPALRELLAPDAAEFSQPVLVADHDGEVVGAFQAFPGHPYAVMGDIVIRPDWRGQKVAGLLMEGMETVLRTMGCPMWVGAVSVKNQPWLDALKRKGAVVTGKSHVVMRRLA